MLSRHDDEGGRKERELLQIGVDIAADSGEIFHGDGVVVKITDADKAVAFTEGEYGFREVGRKGDDAFSAGRAAAGGKEGGKQQYQAGTGAYGAQRGSKHD